MCGCVCVCVCVLWMGVVLGLSSYVDLSGSITGENN